jgi:ABC-type branched-subunit amino acid transport system permease subunit/predicted RNA-binding Zn-ribbon protein involved in translation (DUF1610 family)
VLPLAGLITAVCAIPLGWLALRLRRYAFIVMTIAIFYIGQYLAYNLSGLTNGATGIFLPNPPWDAYFFDIPFYYVALAMLILALAVSWWVRSSKYGLCLLAIRDDEERASSLGIKTGRYKLVAYVLSSIFIGMVGALMVYYTGTAYPYSVFNTNFNVSMAVITFVGGIGTVFGPIVGGFLLVPLQQYLDLQFTSIAANFGLVVFGSILLLTVLVLPEGIVPRFNKYRKKWIAMYNSKHFKETLQPAAFSATAKTSLVHTDPVASQGTFVKSAFIEQPSAPQVVWNIPRRLIGQSVPVSDSLRGNSKLRTQRLVAISHDESRTTQEQMPTSPDISWRCPQCKKPLLLRGNTCYCPRCGFTRPLAEGREALFS